MKYGSSSRLTGRRGFLKKSVGLGGAALLGAIAGCQGQSGGGGEQDITITAFPLSPDAVSLDYADRSGILEDHLSEAGYSYEIQYSFEGAALFASGQSDLSIDTGSLEAAQIGQEHGTEIAIVAKVSTSFLGWCVRADSPYTIDETGGIINSIEAIAADGARIGMLGWAGGDVPAVKMLISATTNLDFSQGADFNASSVDPPAIPSLLVEEEEIDVAATAPTHGSTPYLINDEMVPLFWGSDELSKRMGIVPSLSNILTRQSFIEDEPEAVEAFVNAVNEATSWFHNDGIDEVPEDEGYRERLRVGTPEEARYVMGWVTGNEVKYAFDTTTPRLYEDISLTEEDIRNDQAFLDRAAELGQGPENWPDFVTYESI